MKKNYFALITCALAFAAQAAIEVPEQFVGSYVAKGEKCDRKADGKFKTEAWLNVTNRSVEVNSLDYEANDGSYDSLICSPMKAFKVKGNSGSFQSRCGGEYIGTWRLKKIPNGLEYTYLGDVGSPVLSYIACPSK